MSRKTAIFLGNSIFGDDQIGLIVGSMLTERLADIGFDVQIAERTGFALVDCLEGYDSAVVVDSICTGSNPLGEVLSYAPEDFATADIAVPHFAGVPEATQLMKALNIRTAKLAIVGINVKDPFTLSENLSDELSRMTDTISKKVYARIVAQAGSGTRD